MFRTASEVEKHVDKIFRKISNEKERNFRCYNVAKLYFHVGDYLRTKQYVQIYLKERPGVAGAHKLLGQALEGLQESSKALEEYKFSLSLESKQPDLVLKVCELLVETKSQITSGEADYWIKRAEEFSDNHPSVFRLKEYIIRNEGGSGDQAKLMELVEKEIEARPQDPLPRVRILRLYLGTKRVLDAYKYCIDLEARSLFCNDIVWYTSVVDVFKAYHQEFSNLDWEFYLNQLCVLERYTALCSHEQQASAFSSFISAVLLLDQALYEASKFSQNSGEHLLEECVKHMSGQLCFHLGTALLRCEKQRRSDWKDKLPLVWALMAVAYSSPEAIDLPSHCFSSDNKEKYRKLLKIWKADRAFRCSQAGHILLSLPNGRRLFLQLNSASWRGKCFKAIFAVHSIGKQDIEKSSYFLNDDRCNNIPDSTPSMDSLACHDDLALSHRPDSLQALVWLGLQYVERAVKHTSPVGCSYVLPHRLLPSFDCHLFDELRLSTSNLGSNGVETLSRLDVHTFLYASVFCAAAAQDGLYSNSQTVEARPRVLPVDLTESLCNEAQLKWWTSFYRLHSNKSRSDIGEVRMIVLRGLEVVRLMGNHGMNVRLVVLLAKLFSDKAYSSSTQQDSIQDYTKRALMFWKSAIALLERLQKNRPLRMPTKPLFSYNVKDLTDLEIAMLLEEGKLFITCQLIKEENYEEAINCIQNLKNPYASFYEGSIFKKLADQIGKKLRNPVVAAHENLTHDEISELKSQYFILLQKSRSALNLTLDRVRSPQFAGNHMLDLELAELLEEVEKCLEENDSTSGIQSTSESALDTSIYPSRFDDSLQNVSQICNTSMHHAVMSTLRPSNGQSPFLDGSSTPLKNKHNLDSSWFLNESTSRRMEARPSPERLDAQLRRMTASTESVMQMLVEQNRQITDTVKNVRDTLDKTKDAVEELRKQMADLRCDVGRLKVGESHSQIGKSGNYHPEEEQEFDNAASQLRSLQAYATAAPYYNSQGYNYDSRNPANALPMQPILPQPVFPPTQVPMVQNVDSSRIWLPSYYPQTALGLNFSERQSGGGLGLVNALPGSLQNPVGPAPSAPATLGGNVVPTPSDILNAAVPFQRVTPVLGTPIISHASLNSPAIDLSTSSGMTSVPHSQAMRVTSDIQQSLTSRVPMGFLGSGETTPHNFQISMPSQVTVPTTESLAKSLSPIKPISVETFLPNVPMPAYSAVASKQSHGKPCRVSTGSASGNDSFTEEAEYNPCADFKPIIPLPEEIVVTTGEEDESPLFVRRAKLFRFVGGEWKERGIGDMKILKHNVSGKPRVLMRREQVHKICANHLILPEMELAPQTGSDRAWSWGAHDYADGEPQVEKLCVRFKTVEDAQEFKAVFDAARKLAKVASPVKPFTPAVSAMTSESKLSPAKNFSPSGKVEVGGFSFTSPPVLKPMERQTKTAPSKDKENASSVTKPSPFANFSFTPTSSNVFNASSTSALTFSSQSTTSILSKPVLGIGLTQSTTIITGNTPIYEHKPLETSISSSVPPTPMFCNSNTNLLDFAALATQNKTVANEKKDVNFKGFEGAGSQVFGSKTSTTTGSVDQESGDSEDFVPTADFKPVIPLPSLVEVRTGEEDEEVMFEERSKLLRFDTKEGQWKERGTGKMKVLKNPKTCKVRLLMRREQVLKVCCNHFITPEIQFSALKTSDKALSWSAQDYSEGEVRAEVFALKFKTPELMNSFKETMERLQKQMVDDEKNGKLEKSKENDQPQSNDSGVVKPLSGLFKPEIQASVGTVPTGPQFVLGTPKSSSQTSNVCVSDSKTALKISSTSKETKPSLAEMFKPEVGSWECSGCFTRNTGAMIKCPCCSQPKPGSETQVTVSQAVPESQFTFGIPTSYNNPLDSDSVKNKQPSLSEMFKPKEGSWVCQGCYTRGDPDQVKCRSCETPRPGHVNEKSDIKTNFGLGNTKTNSATFTFGTSGNFESQKSGTKSFLFDSSAQRDESKPSFTFGGSNLGSTDAGKGFSFGSNSSQGANAAGASFVFGTTTVTPSQQTSFGSPHKFEFQLKPASSVKSPAKSPGAPSEGEDSEEEVEEENCDVGDFKPVVPLPDKVPVLTGEENETILYSHRAKLFRFVEGEWKERGLGDIKILRHNLTNKARLLMRREQVLKICLNHIISSDLTLHSKDEKTWMWAAQDFSEGVLVAEKFGCRFKSPEIAAEFKASIEKAKAECCVSSPIAKTGESITSPSDESSSKESSSALKNFSFKLSGNEKSGISRSLFGSKDTSSSHAPDELQIVYEAEASPEEKSAALKLKLPENFYLYKQVPPCAGCSGCENDSDSDQVDNQTTVESSNQSTAAAFNATAAVFGSGASLFSSTSFSAPSSTHIFGGISKTGLGSALGGGTVNSGLGSTAVNSHSTAFPILGSKFAVPIPKDNNAKEEGSEKSETSVFLPVSNSPSFASIAAASSKEEPFKKAESVPFLPVSSSPSFASLVAASPVSNVFQPTGKSFIFEGAGAKVFGKPVLDVSKNDEHDEHDEHDPSEGAGETDTHDPHFEPIIAMPDMVEVRTGEEDEERVFCQRAKLFRFVVETKEWKERGVGEMKILKDPARGTYRLLLRREQVHKVVLNQRLDAKLKLNPLNTSDRAWCWGGMNHAEDPEGALEELAVRFKNSEVAEEFRLTFEECQKKLAEGGDAEVPHDGPQGVVIKEVEDVEDEEVEEEDDDDDEYEDEDEENETYTEGEYEVLFEKPGSFTAGTDGTDHPDVQGMGYIKILVHAQTSYFIEMEDESGQVLCRAPILDFDNIDREAHTCIWKSLDDKGVEKKFTTTFDSEDAANFFQELHNKLSIEVLERTYHYVNEDEDSSTPHLKVDD